MWYEDEEPKRYDWKEGSLIIPPDQCFHQHFNTGQQPARYLALRFHRSAIVRSKGIKVSSLSTREGGDQIMYADEAAVVREMYAQECAANGVQIQMEEHYASE